MISGFRREVAEICATLGCYAASSGNFLTDVSGQPIGPILRVQESKRKTVAPKRYIGKCVGC